MFSNRAKNDDARMERKKSERHQAGCPPLLFLSILLSVAHLFDLRQPKAERRVDPLQELVASHEVGAVRGRGHRVMMFFSSAVVVVDVVRGVEWKKEKCCRFWSSRRARELSAGEGGEKTAFVGRARRREKRGKRFGVKRTRDFSKEGTRGRARAKDTIMKVRKSRRALRESVFIFFPPLGLPRSHRRER